MRPTRNSNQGRRATHINHNWPEHRQIVCGITGEAVCNGLTYPTESVFLPCSHESPQCETTLLVSKTVQMVNLIPTNHAWQSSGYYCSEDDWLKTKQQCKSEMGRSDSGILWNLSKVRYESSLLQCWLARWLAETAPTASQQVHSCLPSSAHPSSKTFLSELAIEGQQHQLHRWLGPPQTDAHGHAPQGTLADLPPVAPAHPRSMDFRWNPARAYQVFRKAGTDHGQSDDCLGTAATFHDAHVWAGRHSSCKPDSKNGLAYW